MQKSRTQLVIPLYIDSADTQPPDVFLASARIDGVHRLLATFQAFLNEG